MNKEIENLKAELEKACKEHLSDETVKVTFELNSYGFYTRIEERSADSLKHDGVSMKNLKGNWIE